MAKEEYRQFLGPPLLRKSIGFEVRMSVTKARAKAARVKTDELLAELYSMKKRGHARVIRRAVARLLRTEERFSYPELGEALPRCPSVKSDTLQPMSHSTFVLWHRAGLLLPQTYQDFYEETGFDIGDSVYKARLSYWSVWKGELPPRSNPLVRRRPPEIVRDFVIWQRKQQRLGEVTVFPVTLKDMRVLRETRRFANGPFWSDKQMAGTGVLDTRRHVVYFQQGVTR